MVSFWVSTTSLLNSTSVVVVKTAEVYSILYSIMYMYNMSDNLPSVFLASSLIGGAILSEPHTILEAPCLTPWLSRGSCTAEEVHQGSNYALRHALACTINCAITHMYKNSWLLKP